VHQPSAPSALISTRIGGAIGLPAPITGLNIRTPPLRLSTEAGSAGVRRRSRRAGGYLAQPPRAVAEHVGADLGPGEEVGQRPQFAGQFGHGGAAAGQIFGHLFTSASGQRTFTHRTTSTASAA
jgi:hypothetical protein